MSARKAKTPDGEQAAERLLAHLKMGGTRKGACGSAGIGYRELCQWLEEDPQLAEEVEKAECEYLAGDERRLAASVEDGDRQSLLFRLRRAYQGEKNGKRSGAGKADDSTRKEYEKIACRLGELTQEERSKMVEVLRGDKQPAGAVA